MKTRVAVLTILLAVFATLAFAQMDLSHRISRVENGLIPAVVVKGEPAWNILERMRHYKTPGASIAVIDSFRIAWAKAYGVKDAKTNEPATTRTLFQAASISKTLNATAVMAEVQKGRLSLDVDVNQYLSSWKLPCDSPYAGAKVTLANLLSHTGGTTVHGFPGYVAGTPLPTVQQVLNGEPPANTAPIVVNAEPGKRFSYSGGGITITQLVLTELEGKLYPEILKALVLDRLEMRSSTFAQPLPVSRLAEASSAHGLDGSPITGKFHVYPEMAAAGLWTTPEDLAKFAIEHQLSLHGKSNLILTREFEQKMLSPYIGEGYGLGFGIEKRGEDEYFEHSGGNAGFSCLLIAHKYKGYGAVVMINANSYALIPEIIRSIAREYNWDYYLPDPVEIVRLDSLLMKRVLGRYALGWDQVIQVSEYHGKLFGTDLLSPPTEILPTSDTGFVTRDRGDRVVLMKGTTPRLDTLRFFSGSNSFNIGRMPVDQLTPFECLIAGKLDVALLQYRERKQKSPSDPLVGEDRLNLIGYILLGRDLTDAAIAVLKLNTEIYPQSWNTFDSLGEALAKKGDKQAAIQSYEQALKLNPKAEAATKALQDLRK
jgi:CubicO group peptidase (beta-lactamase class C family)